MPQEYPTNCQRNFYLIARKVLHELLHVFSNDIYSNSKRNSNRINRRVLHEMLDALIARENLRELLQE